MHRGRVKFGTVGSSKSRAVAGVLDHRQLHAKANPQVGNLMFTGIADGLYFSLDTAFAKASRNQNGIKV